MSVLRSLPRALLLFAVLAVTPSACGDPPAPGDGSEDGSIAFAGAADFGTPFDIFTVNQADGSLQQLTSYPGEDYEPVWSADGSEIYFTSEGRAAAGPAIFLMRSDGSDVRLLTAHPFASSGGLSPDRSRVTYVDGLGDVYVSALDGSAAQLVAAVGVQQECPGGIRCNRYATHPRWSPDRSTIAFVVISEGRGGSRYGDLRLVRSDGTGLRSIGGGPASVLDPEWSADGTRIAVFSNIGYGGTIGNTWVYLVAAGTWNVATLYADQVNDGRPLAVMFGVNWSPGGEDLVYSTYRSDPADSVAESALWEIASGGGGTPRRIHTGVGLYGTPARQPSP